MHGNLQLRYCFMNKSLNFVLPSEIFTGSLFVDV